MAQCDQCGMDAGSARACPACGDVYCGAHAGRADHDCVDPPSGLRPYFLDRQTVPSGDRPWYAYVLLAVVIVPGLLGLLVMVIRILGRLL